jgi:uncharacterized OB-fold protein
VPAVDELSAPYWAATALHELVLARCSHCRMFVHPPDVLCPHCGSTEPSFAFEPVSGRGRVRTWTTVRQSLLPGFEVPYVLADVALDEQEDLRLVGRLIGADGRAPLLDSPVRVVFEEVAPGVAVPGFTLAEDQ